MSVKQPTSESRAHRSAVLAALFVTFLWSSSWVLIRWGLDDEGLEPITFAGLRYVLAAAALATVVAVGQRESIQRVSRKVVGRLVVLGLVFYALTQGAQFVAIDNQPAATTSLLLAMSPIVVVGLSSLTLGERASSRQAAGVALVVSGALLYFVGDLGATVVGMIAALTALVANSISALLGRAINRTQALPPVTVTAVSMATGALVLLGAGVAVEGIPSLSARGWLIISWLALVNTALAFTLWNFSLRRLSATESAVINNTMLVQIALLAWLFLGEVPGLAEVAGIALVSFGAVVSQLAPSS
ncbi:MAG: DMT family transporter [Acidimicrobiia bacterium]